MSENNLTGYEKRYNAVYNYLDTHKALKNILLLLYKVLPYVTALSYMVLIVLCARSKSTIATPAIPAAIVEGLKIMLFLFLDDKRNRK